MTVGYTRSRLRKWIEELKEARAAVAKASREATGKRKTELKKAALAAEEAIYAATLAASDLANDAKLARQAQKLAHLLNAAARAQSLAVVTRATLAAHKFADEAEEEGDMVTILYLLH